ncbi:hypothetical protein E0S44_15290 [Salmonella enterica subsp. enterica serovar Orion]|nr:hypothetical protein [Salmonella enterica subsp. enterica serovar Orion]
MGHLPLNSDYLSAKDIKDTIYIYYKSKKSCLSKLTNIIPREKGDHKLISYRLQASQKDDYEHYVYIKDIIGDRTNCGIISYPYNILTLANLMHECNGVRFGKLELHSNLVGYPSAKNIIINATSMYGFSFLFESRDSLKNFLELYNKSIVSKRLHFNDICREIRRNDLLEDIYDRCHAIKPNHCS